MTSFRVIGKHRPRIDGRARVTGQLLYADDISLPRMVYCKLLRSHLPHASIRNIDTTKASALDGVYLVLTGDDFPIKHGILPVSQDEYALCRDKTRFVGDPYAAVIAKTEEIAQNAVELIEAELEPLTTISNSTEALSVETPRIHTYGEEGNIHKRVAFDFGHVDQSLKDADHIFEDLFFYEGNTHLPLEQHASVATTDPDGKLAIWSSTQTPHYLHRALAKTLQLPATHIRVIATPNGGGFGGKSDPFNHEVIVAKAAMLLNRPVKITLTREEVFYCHRGRHPVLMRLKTGTDKQGLIVGQSLDTVLDGGAYGSYGVASTFYTGALQTVTYHIPRYQFRGCRTFTNKPPCGPKRGHGTPQPRFGLEIQLDKMAVSLGINPKTIRTNQLAKPHSVTANYLQLGTVGLGDCIDKVTEASDFETRWGNLPEGHGLGLACSSYLCGAGLPIYWNDMPHSGVQLKLDRLGGVTVFCGSTEIGQGSNDVLAACVSEILGIDPFDIRVITGDTDLTPVDLGSYSSRVTLMTGNAAIEAATRARDIIASVVSKQLGIPKNQLVFADRRVFSSEHPDKGISFQEAMVATETEHGTLGTTGSYRPPPAPGKYKGAGVGPSPTYSYSASVIEVRVNKDTGQLDVVKIWMAHDIGTCINRTLVFNQIEGSIYMGLGEALMEEQTFRRLPQKRSSALVHKIPSLLDYKSPTMMDMPPCDIFLVEYPDKQGPFGAKEVGQGPLLPIMPAIANAVYDAVGVRIDETPITPDKIFKAMNSSDKRVGPKDFPSINFDHVDFIPPPWEGGDGNAFVPPHPHQPRR